MVLIRIWHGCKFPIVINIILQGKKSPFNLDIKKKNKSTKRYLK